MKAPSKVSPSGAASGTLRKMRKKPVAWVRKPSRMIGSRPYLLVREPRMPKRAPPVISPTPMKMPDRPTSDLLSARRSVAPT